VCKELYSIELENTLGEVFDMVSKILSEEGWESWAYGSALTGLSELGYDVDISVHNANEENVKKSLGKIRNTIKYQLGQINVVKCDIRRAKVPILDMVIKHHRNEVNVQMSINNGTGMKNSIWIMQLTNLEPRLKILYYAIKVWAKQNMIKNSMNGSFSSYGIALMIISYMQLLPVKILPCILGFIKSDLDNNEWNVDTLTAAVRGNLGDFEPAKQSCTEILVGFFKFYSKFDFTKYAIVPELGIFKRKTIVEEKPVTVIDPFDGNNTMKCVTREGFVKIRKVMEEANIKCQKGLENMEDFATLLGIRKEQIGEEEVNKLGIVGSVDGHEIMIQTAFGILIALKEL
jgi:poly(A) RNA polymerase GLD2